MTYSSVQFPTTTNIAYERTTTVTVATTATCLTPVSGTDHGGLDSDADAGEVFGVAHEVGDNWKLYLLQHVVHLTRMLNLSPTGQDAGASRGKVDGWETYRLHIPVVLDGSTELQQGNVVSHGVGAVSIMSEYRLDWNVNFGAFVLVPLVFSDSDSECPGFPFISVHAMSSGHHPIGCYK